MSESSKTLGGFSSKFVLFSIIAVIVIVIVFVPLLQPAFDANAEQFIKRRCLARMKQIGYALKLYAMDNDGKFPSVSGVAGLELLRANGYLSSTKMFICPTKKTSQAKLGEALTEATVDYVYIGGLTEKDSADSVILYDKDENHRNYRNLLYIDGHARGFAEKDWKRHIK